MKQQLLKIWGAPLLLTVLILFGLLAALLGSGYWYGLAWAAMLVPLAVIIYRLAGSVNTNRCTMTHESHGLAFRNTRFYKSTKFKRSRNLGGTANQI